MPHQQQPGQLLPVKAIIEVARSTTMLPQEHRLLDGLIEEIERGEPDDYVRKAAEQSIKDGNL